MFDKETCEVEIIDLSVDSKYVKCPRCRDMHACKENFWVLCDRCCGALDFFPDEMELPLEDKSGVIKISEIKKGIKEAVEKQREKYLGE